MQPCIFSRGVAKKEQRGAQEAHCNFLHGWLMHAHETPPQRWCHISRELQVAQLHFCIKAVISRLSAPPGKAFLSRSCSSLCFNKPLVSGSEERTGWGTPCRLIQRPGRTPCQITFSAVGAWPRHCFVFFFFLCSCSQEPCFRPLAMCWGCS